MLAVKLHLRMLITLEHMHRKKSLLSVKCSAVPRGTDNMNMAAICALIKLNCWFQIREQLAKVRPLFSL